MADGLPIVTATQDDILAFARRRFPDDESRALYAELARSAPGGAFVAKDLQTPVGIAFAHAGEEAWYVSEVFVEPSFAGSGTARGLLEAAFASNEDVAREALVDATQSRASAFAARLGVPLRTPVFRLAGEIAREEELARMAAGSYRFAAQPVELPRDATALDWLDRETRGTARSGDHEYFSRHAFGTTFGLQGENVGYAYVWPGGRIGPIALASPAYAVQILAYALMSARSAYGASWCSLLVPGTNLRLLRAALRSGLRIEQTLLFASQNDRADLSRYAGFHHLLF